MSVVSSTRPLTLHHVQLESRASVISRNIVFYLTVTEKENARSLIILVHFHSFVVHYCFPVLVSVLGSLSADGWGDFKLT